MSDKTQDSEGQKVFRGELFGFNRVEVLSYIERISAANAEKAKALGETIEKLQKELSASLQGQQTAEGKLASLQQEHETFLNRTKDICVQLETEKARAESAVKQADQLQQELRKSSSDASAFRQRLLAREKELEQLRQENTGLTDKIAKLEESIRVYEAKQKTALSEREQLAAQAKLVLEKAKVKADDLVKEAQAKAQVKLDQADSQAALILAKANEEKTLLKAKMSESADSIAASVLVLKSQLAHVNEEIVSASNELLKATDGIAAALENTQRDLEKLGVQMQNYPQQTPVPHYAPPPRAGQTTDQPVASAYTGTQEPFDEARYRASLERVRCEEEQKDQYYDALAREDLRRARAGIVSGSGQTQQARDAQWNEALYRRVSQEQEKEWRRAQTTQYPYDRQQVVQQPVTGHLHRPTAMPFAPFDDSVPHTPSYPEQRELQPQQWEEEYVPSPTPVTAVASFSQPYTAFPEEPATQSAPAPEQMPRIRRTPASTVKRSTAVPQEPVIIPYDAPIPQMIEPRTAAVEQSAATKASSEDSVAHETTLSDALLENLNQLLNGK